MSLWSQFRRLVEDQLPAFVFELSAGGIAYATGGRTVETGFVPLAPEVLFITPVRDNVNQPHALEKEAAKLAHSTGRKRREAALILPDYCARVAVLDFESFPSDKQEQLSLVRFRMKKTVPFDLDAASIGYHVQSRSGQKEGQEVVAAAAAEEIVARYEAPFRAAGLQPGFVTTSTLAALDLLPPDGITVFAKRSGKVLSIAVTAGRTLKLLRCVELDGETVDEVMAVLLPTIAFAEDEMPERPSRLLVCGFGDVTWELSGRCEAEAGMTAEPLRSARGVPGEGNAGLFGYLHANQVN